jgi:hypothetical protein
LRQFRPPVWGYSGRPELPLSNWPNLPPLWQAMKNMRLQGIHVNDIVEQHRKAVAIEKGFKEINLPSNVSFRRAEMAYAVCFQNNMK